MSSIHSRITLVFTSLAILMGALAAMAFIDMLFMEDRVHQAMVLSQLENTVMAMRLEEKNLFMFDDKSYGRNAEALADAVRPG